MNPVPSAHTARRVIARAVARWLLLVAVAAGVFGMHALTAEDTGHGHGVLPVASGPAADHAGMNPAAAAVSAFDPGGFQTVAGDAGHGGDTATMAGCLLFLVVGAAALIAALLRALRSSDRAAADRAAAALTGVRRRAPPRRPRVALCVIRT